jgi:hypothetical protein
VQEAFDLPGLRIEPGSGFIASGPPAGPFAPDVLTMTLTNLATNSLPWSLVNTSSWLHASALAGVINVSNIASVEISLDGSATNLASGVYFGSVVFSNETTLSSQERQFTLRIGQPDAFTEIFSSADNDLAHRTLTFTPDASSGFYSLCREAAGAFPTDPAAGNVVSLTDDSYAPITLAGANTIALYGQRTNLFFIGSNGYLTLNSGDGEFAESAWTHFNLPRVAAFFHDLNPGAGGTVSWKQLNDRVAVTFQNVPQYGAVLGNNFQIELFYDGRIRLTYLALSCLSNLVGLSSGAGVPLGFVESDFSAANVCPPTPPLIVTQPQSQGVQPGPNITFNASAMGSEPLTYQWRMNGTNLIADARISGVSSASLSILNVVESDSGLYQLLVTNEFGLAISSNASLVVSPLDHFVWSHIPSPQSAQVPFSVTLQARDSLDAPVTNYHGPVSLSATNAGITVEPGVTGSFSQGTWNGSVTLPQAISNLVLKADDGFGHTGLTSLQVAGAPQLQTEFDGNLMLILWPAGAPLLQLETTTNLSQGIWTIVPGPVQFGDQFSIQATNNEPSRFYRLRYSAP